MKAARLFSCLAACLLLALATNPSSAQQPEPNPYAAACGSTEADFTVKHAPSADNAMQPPAGKALVYITESMPDLSIYTTKVNIGLDGAWLGATDAASHISFTVDPGIHHLCAVYQGEAAPMDAEGQTLLLRLNAQAGQTYYISYHAFFLREYPGIARFEFIDEDEGQLLVQRTPTATSKLKK
jgi:hypothetical protein